MKLYPTLPAIDSLKVFSLNEKSYTYTPVGGGAPQTVEVGSEYVLEPKELYVDHIKYADKTTCDSATIVVKYVIPVKITRLKIQNGVVILLSTMESNMQRRQQ